MLQLRVKEFPMIKNVSEMKKEIRNLKKYVYIDNKFKRKHKLN